MPTENSPSIGGLETRLLLWIHNSLPTNWVREMTLITDLGGIVVMVAVCLLGSVVLLKRKKIREAGLLATSFVLSTVVDVVVKLLVHRPRPQLWDHVREFSFSFPSGHSLRSVVIYGILAFLIGRHNPHLKLVTWMFYGVFVGLIGFSRLYLGVHWPSDVLASWIIAATMLWAALLWYGAKKSA